MKRLIHREKPAREPERAKGVVERAVHVHRRALPQRVGAVLARREETIAGAMEAGADGFLAKDASSRQVAGAIRTLVDGKGSIVAAAEPASRPVRDPSVDLRVRTLSGREREILSLSVRRVFDKLALEEEDLAQELRLVLTPGGGNGT